VNHIFEANSPFFSKIAPIFKIGEGIGWEIAFVALFPESLGLAQTAAL
jgi:hypothetical protein